MSENLKQRILGIPGAPETDGKDVRPKLGETDNHVPLYLPESRVPKNGTEGVAIDGSTWLEWRVDPSGEQWYHRTSRDEPPAMFTEFEEGGVE